MRKTVHHYFHSLSLCYITVSTSELWSDSLDYYHTDGSFYGKERIVGGITTRTIGY